MPNTSPDFPNPRSGQTRHTHPPVGLWTPPGKRTPLRPQGESGFFSRFCSVMQGFKKSAVGMVEGFATGNRDHTTQLPQSPSVKQISTEDAFRCLYSGPTIEQSRYAPSAGNETIAYRRRLTDPIGQCGNFHSPSLVSDNGSTLSRSSSPSACNSPDSPTSHIASLSPVIIVTPPDSEDPTPERHQDMHYAGHSDKLISSAAAVVNPPIDGPCRRRAIDMDRQVDVTTIVQRAIQAGMLTESLWDRTGNSNQRQIPGRNLITNSLGLFLKDEPQVESPWVRRMPVDQAIFLIGDAEDEDEDGLQESPSLLLEVDITEAKTPGSSDGFIMNPFALGFLEDK